jgi:hypothetical protein
MTKCQVIFLPYKVTSNVTAEDRIKNYKMNERLQLELSNYLDSIRHLPTGLFKYKKGMAHKLIRSKWELIHGDKDS